MSPTPRTSRIRSGWRACSARSPSRSWSPRAAAFSTSRSSASTSSVASAAAHATALPAYVPPSVPGSVRPAIAAVVETAESGRPEPMPLGHHQYVGRDAAVLVRPHPPGAPDAALHLVEDEQYPVRVAPLAQPGEEGGRRGDVAALAEHGLDDERRRVRRRRLLLEHEVELVERAVDAEPGRLRLVWKRRGEAARHVRKPPAPYAVLLRVSASVAAERPWYPPWKEMTFCRPVDAFAMRTAFSTASAPVVDTITRSCDAGSTPAISSSTSATSGECSPIDTCPCSSASACAWMARTIFGWQCPVFVTPMPHVKSRYVAPSAAVSHGPSPTRSRGRPTSAAPAPPSGARARTTAGRLMAARRAAVLRRRSISEDGRAACRAEARMVLRAAADVL